MLDGVDVVGAVGTDKMLENGGEVVWDADKEGVEVVVKEVANCVEDGSEEDAVGEVDESVEDESEDAGSVYALI